MSNGNNDDCSKDFVDKTKRVHYFDRQFLHVEDVIQEQCYHLDRRRRHNRLLHTSGIAGGFSLEARPDGEETKVGISSGTAIDKEGREIVFITDEQEKIDLVEHQPGASVYITIRYREQKTDHTAETGAEGDTRWHENPEIITSVDPPVDDEIDLVLGVAERLGTRVENVDESGRRKAGVEGGDLEVISLALKDPQEQEPSENWPKMRMSAIKKADMEGTLRVTGNLIVDGSIQGDIAAGTIEVGDLGADAVTSANIADADNSTGQDTTQGTGIKTPHIQNEAVTGAKIENNTIPEGKLDTTAQGKLVTNGNSHDHSGGDGGQISHSSLVLDGGTNPHATTAADVDTTGGTNRIVSQINSGAGTISQARIDNAIARDSEVNAKFHTSTGHEHDGTDSKRISHSNLLLDGGTNPHATTAADIDTTGGTNRIVSQINAGTGIIGQARIDSAIARDSEVNAKFHTSTGHDHDGVDSKRILPTNLNGVSSSVTAPHLNTLTGGAASNASDLHYHVGIPLQTKVYTVHFPIFKMAVADEFVGRFNYLKCPAGQQCGGYAPVPLRPGCTIRKIGAYTAGGGGTFELRIICRYGIVDDGEWYHFSRVLSITSAGYHEVSPNHLIEPNRNYVLELYMWVAPSSILFIHGVVIQYQFSALF